MWFSYPNQEDWIPLKVDRVKEIMAMNKKGEKPDNLKDEAVAIKTNVVVEKVHDYENVVGQDSLTRLDDKSRNKNNRNKNNQSRNRNNKPANQNTPRPQNQNAPQTKPNPAQNATRPIAEGGAPTQNAQRTGNRNNRNKNRNQNRNKPSGENSPKPNE